MEKNLEESLKKRSLKGEFFLNRFISGETNPEEVVKEYKSASWFKKNFIFDLDKSLEYLLALKVIEIRNFYEQFK